MPFSIRDATVAHPPAIIIKLGGSLLDLPDLGQRVAQLIRQQPACRPLFIVGGGMVADCVRDWHQTFSLSEATSHGLALQSMSLTAALLEKVLPQGRCVQNQHEAEACWQLNQWPILQVSAWLNECAENRAGLPESWLVTSDSLAAWVSVKWAVAELWLLKSIDLPQRIDLESIQELGLVDGYFSDLARSIPRILWCNMRVADLRLREFDFRQSNLRPG